MKLNITHIVAAVALLSAGAQVFAQEATSDAWMHAASVKTTAQVRAELDQARRDGTIKFGSSDYIEKLPATKTRDQVRSETLAARRSGELDRIDGEAYIFSPVRQWHDTAYAGVSSSR